jgi:hypothetical protein
MLSTIGRAALIFVIVFDILNTAAQTLMISYGLPSLPFSQVVTPQTFASVIASLHITAVPAGFMLYIVSTIIFNALINFVAGLPLIAMQLASLIPNPAVQILIILVGYFAQLAAIIFLLQVLAQAFYPV